MDAKKPSTWIIWIVTVAVLGLGCYLVVNHFWRVPVLTIVVREGLEADGLSELAEEYGRTHNMSIRVERLGRENYEANVVTDLTSVRPAYDVVFLPGTLVAELADRDAVAPITGISANELDDFFDVVRYREDVFAIPTDVSTFYFIYRDDQIKVIPESWNQVAAAGISMKEGAVARYPFAFACRPGEELPKVFYPFLWSFGGSLIENGKVTLHSKEAVAAAILFRDLTKTKGFPADANTWEVGRILDEFKKGQLASTGPQWNAVYPLVQDAAAPIGANSRATKLPAVVRADGSSHQANFMHFWTLTRSRRSSRPQEANDLILFLTGRTAAERYAVQWKGTPARKSVLRNPEVLKSRPDFALLSDCLATAKAEPNVPYYARMHQVMNDELALLLSGRKSAEDAIRDAAHNITKLQSAQTKKQ